MLIFMLVNLLFIIATNDAACWHSEKAVDRTTIQNHVECILGMDDNFREIVYKLLEEQTKNKSESIQESESRPRSESGIEMNTESELESDSNTKQGINAKISEIESEKSELIEIKSENESKIVQNAQNHKSEHRSVAAGIEPRTVHDMEPKFEKLKPGEKEATNNEIENSKSVVSLPNMAKYLNVYERALLLALNHCPIGFGNQNYVLANWHFLRMQMDNLPEISAKLLLLQQFNAEICKQTGIDFAKIIEKFAKVPPSVEEEVKIRMIDNGKEQTHAFIVVGKLEYDYTNQGLRKRQYEPGVFVYQDGKHIKREALSFNPPIFIAKNKAEEIFKEFSSSNLWAADEFTHVDRNCVDFAFQFVCHLVPKCPPTASWPQEFRDLDKKWVEMNAKPIDKKPEELKNAERVSMFRENP